MGNNKKVLMLIVTEEWFDKIWEGNKLHDYRELKPYWSKRLMNRSYDEVHIINGYGGKRPKMIFKYKGYEITKEDAITDLGIGSFYAIDLSEFIKYENINEGLAGKERVAKEELECMASTWVNNDDLYDYDLTYSDKRTLVKIRASSGKIKKGESYVKLRGVGCFMEERYIYRALPFAHDFNLEHDVYRDAC
jgi:hypothetical protein